MRTPPSHTEPHLAFNFDIAHWKILLGCISVLWWVFITKGFLWKYFLQWKVSVNSSDIFSGCSIVCGKQMETPSIIQVTPIQLLFCCCEKALCPRQRGEEIACVSLQATAHSWGKPRQQPRQGLKKKSQRKATYQLSALAFSATFLIETPSDDAV